MDDHAERMPRDKAETTHTGEEIETTIEGDGDDGELQGVGQLEGAAAEVAHVAGKGASPFGKHGQRSAALQVGFGGAHGVDDALAGRFIDKDEACLFARIAHKGDVTQRLLHHPLKFAAKKSGQKENVERTLVVGDKNVALSGL